MKPSELAAVAIVLALFAGKYLGYTPAEMVRGVNDFLATQAPTTVEPVRFVPAAAGHASEPTPETPFPTPTAADYQQAWQRLETLNIAPANYTSSYDREHWMPGGWATNGGCRTRDVMLTSWAISQQPNRCSPSIATFVDAYTANPIAIPDTDKSQVDIDHSVALAEAHRSGGHSWTSQQRHDFANDSSIRSYHDGGTLLYLTSARENREIKSAADTAGYLPADPYARCGFVVSAIAIKHRYQLSADAEEIAHLTDALTTCQSGQPPERP